MEPVRIPDDFGKASSKVLTKWQIHRLPACLPVMHQLLHVADGLMWLGPMHVYSQWGMERMCGMITRTAKSRVAANRNMEITLLLTEQKHMLGYVLNNVDWPMHERHQPQTGDPGNSEPETTQSPYIEDADGNLSLAKAFAHRLAVSRPEPVRPSIRTQQQGFSFTGRVNTRALRGVEGQRIREFMATRPNYDKDFMSAPTEICIWRWCMFRDKDDNKKADFKVTSWCHKRANNMRNASVVAYKDLQGQQAYAEVQFFFHARLPSELGGVDWSSPGHSDNDTEEEGTGTVVHHLAFIRKIPVERRDRVVKTTGNTGAQAVIAVGAIQSLIGRLKVGGDEYLTAQYTSMLGRMR